MFSTFESCHFFGSLFLDADWLLQEIEVDEKPRNGITGSNPTVAARDDLSILLLDDRQTTAGWDLLSASRPDGIGR